ncbi:MAG: sodium:alanine symporter family protein [Lachnospiraceae bacterium]|nr:sodium:alanine symporter family protein [Lachnospiraceae bacterium]
MEGFISLLEAIDGVVWGPIMLTVLVGTGIYLTIRTRFLCWRNLGHAIGNTISKEARQTKGEGDVSPFAALCTALAATIGTGNIAGVASALAVGGPGALVWMWISAAFGLTSKFTECAMAVRYRIKNEKNEMLGGPMMSMERGIPMIYGDKWKRFGRGLAIAFASFAVVASFGIGNLTQGNSIASAMQTIAGIPMWVVGIVVGAATLIVVVGGLKSISNVASVIVPFMAIFYFVGALIVVLMHITAIPGAFVTMFRMAFSPQAVGGGAAGSVVASMAQAMNKGVARGCFSNEAGMGSAAITAAAATSDDYIKQAYISETGTFWDTFVVCTMTGLCILTSGVMDEVVVNGETVLQGAPLTIRAFESTLGAPGAWLVAIALALFAFSTILGWEYYGEKALEYLTRSTSAAMFYRVVFSIIAFVGCISAFEIAWDIADILNALMIVPNAICMILLVGPLYKDMMDYEKKVRKSK